MSLLACLFIIVSFIGMNIDQYKYLFSVANRISGTFQYPNIFAVYLLINELLMMYKAEDKKDYLIILMLILGIIMNLILQVSVIKSLISLVSL